MNRRIRWGIGSASLIALAACGRAGNQTAATDPAAPETPASAPAPAASPASVPPEEEVRLVETVGLLPPSAQVVPATRVEGAIAFAFRSPQPPGDIVAWYRLQQPQHGFRLLSELEEGSERVLSGATERPAGDFSVRLASDRSGTSGMVLVVLRR